MLSRPSGEKILIAPLDWGLGHATRCVPLIRELSQHNEIIIGCTPSIRHIFDEEFPGFRQTELPSYGISYSGTLPVWLHMLLRTRQFFNVVGTERKIVSDLISNLGLTMIISDSRYGLHATNIPSVLITHQLFIKSPVLRSYIQHVNEKLIRNFTEVWVPDLEGNNGLSGELSHGPHFHPAVRYIGPLSRLSPASPTGSYDFLIFMSGPQPQLNIIEKILYGSAKGNSARIAMITRSSDHKTDGNVTVMTSPGAHEIASLIAAAKTVVCRPGYSTLMDMHALGKKKLVLIPTPGQTEQEYLANYWQEKFGAIALSQRDAGKAFSAF